MTKINVRRFASLGAGLLFVAADASAVLAELKPKLDALGKGYEDFKAANDEKIAELRKGLDDTVTTAKLDATNLNVTALQKEVDALNLKLAAAELGAAGDGKASPEQKAYKAGFGNYFRKGVDAGLGDMAVKARLTTSSDADGGYLVPSETEAGVTRVLGQTVAMRRLARVLPIGAPEYKKIISMGGASSGWVGEESARPETNTPTLRELVFTPGEIYAKPKATQTMLDDAMMDVESWIAAEVEQEFTEKEGAAFCSGDGIKKPRGFLDYTQVANGSYAWGSIGYVGTGGSDFAASPASADAILDLVYALKPSYRQNGKFLMNDLIAGKVRKFKDSNGDYVWQPSLQAGQPAQLLGYAVDNDDNMPDVGANNCPIAFADWQRFYLIVDRIGIRVLRNPYAEPPYVQFYTTKRVGGGVQNFEAGKLLKCA